MCIIQDKTLVLSEEKFQIWSALIPFYIHQISLHFFFFFFFFFFLYLLLGTSPNKVFRFGNVTLNPDVIHIPGTETGSLDLDILQPISGHQIRVDIAIKKNVLFGFQDIPCFGNKNGNWYVLTFTTFWANSADDKLMIFFLFAQEIGFDISCK